MIRKSVKRFSEEIMRKQGAGDERLHDFGILEEYA